jgi:hypothetical protein
VGLGLGAGLKLGVGHNMSDGMVGCNERLLEIMSRSGLGLGTGIGVAMCKGVPLTHTHS